MAASRTTGSDNVVHAGDVLIVGAGLAGLFTALKCERPVTILSPAPMGSGTSSTWAQGGIAAALGADDAPELHARDTEAAGAGIVDPQVARLLANDAAARIADLTGMGVPFDRDRAGNLVLGREAAHGRNRIVRVTGDRAGAEIMATLVRRVKETPRIRVLEGLLAYELAMEDGRVAGVYAHPVGDKASTILIRAQATILAMGGIGGLYEVTTNPPQARGQGVGMAARKGAVIADPEFVQFHPTAIAVGRDPAPLATEALRGEGAILVNDRGERFMPGIHADAELAPRDVVARAIFRQLRQGRRVFLDASKAVGARFPDAFPTVHACCMAAGIDPSVAKIPVAPAAHYHMGGISVDHNARTSLPSLWAIGECSSTGAHGANRLASNSLLEALVFGARAAADINAAVGHSQQARSAILPPESQANAAQPSLAPLRRIMTANVGLERNAEDLLRAIDFILKLEKAAAHDPDLRNMAATCLLVAGAALLRTESRGGHFRSDFPTPRNEWSRRTFLTLDEVRASMAAGIETSTSSSQPTAGRA